MTIHQDYGSDAIVGIDPNIPQKRRLLFLSLECNFSPFSGNGVLARSLVSSLVRRKDCIVRVICARPHPSTPSISKDICMATSTSGDDSDLLEIWPVDLPQSCQWKRLDRMGPWEEYATACGEYANRVKEFEPTNIVAVDWHGMLAWESICQHIFQQGDTPGDDEMWRPCNATICYYNFRVYSSSTWEHSTTSDRVEESDDYFYRQKEQLSCRLANGIICLAEHDKCMIQKLIDDDNSHEPTGEKIKHVGILHPPLRGDIRELASREEEKCFNHHLPQEAKHAMKSSPIQQYKQRLFITCMVRFSPEKSAHHFVTLLRKLGGVDFLRRNSLMPIICGSKSVDTYATKVVDDFQSLCSSCPEGEAWPCVVIHRHLGPRELAAVFSRTAVNIHPCIYDAYGMTMVESAAFGAPSIVNSGGKVGAASLLGEGKGCIAVDLEKIVDANVGGDDNYEKQTIDYIRALFTPMDNPQKAKTGEIAKEARCQALGWDEMASCQGLIDILDGLPRDG